MHKSWLFTAGESGHVDTMEKLHHTDNTSVAVHCWRIRACRYHGEAASYRQYKRIHHVHNALLLLASLTSCVEPRVGGRWEWHQDFGYWYEVGCLQPEKMLSVMVAIDAATVENGCLEVLRGSHKLGRLHHGNTGEQVEYIHTYISMASYVHRSYTCLLYFSTCSCVATDMILVTCVNTF